MHSRLFVPLAIVALLGCTGDRSNEAPAVQPDSTPRVQAPAPAQLSCEGLETSILAVPATRAELRRAYGEPDSIFGTTEPNRHVPGAVDSLFSVYYQGLTAGLRTPSGARDMVEHVTVRDNRFLRYPHIGIGATPSDIVAALGEPTARVSMTLVYDCGDATDQPVTFHLQTARVDSIQIHYYVD